MKFLVLKTLFLIGLGFFLVAPGAMAASKSMVKDQKIMRVYTPGLSPQSQVGGVQSETLQRLLVKPVESLPPQDLPTIEPVRYAQGAFKVFKYMIIYDKQGNVSMTLPIEVCSVQLPIPVFDTRGLEGRYQYAWESYKCETELYGKRTDYYSGSTITISDFEGEARKYFSGFGNYRDPSVKEGVRANMLNGNDVSTKTLDLRDVKFVISPDSRVVGPRPSRLEILYSTIEIDDVNQ